MAANTALTTLSAAALDMFAIAGEAVARFQSIKTERGLIDYEDMEQPALRALDVPAVAERLDDELELLLVDEFQDTNPMQLALFMKLARFARKVIFVGDVKQAIYGFRGSDPELVHCTLDAIRERGCSLDVLESSWRSRPPLVRYLNTVFTAAFHRDGIDRALVELTPEREETHGAPAVVRWTLPRARAAEQADALAGAIADLVESQHTVNDRESREREREIGRIELVPEFGLNECRPGRERREYQLPVRFAARGSVASNVEQHGGNPARREHVPSGRFPEFDMRRGRGGSVLSGNPPIRRIARSAYFRQAARSHDMQSAITDARLESLAFVLVGNRHRKHSPDRQASLALGAPLRTRRRARRSSCYTDRRAATPRTDGRDRS